jgi:hypothetical protein
VPGTLATHAVLSDLTQLDLDHWQQAPERTVIAVPPRVQESGDVS